MSYENAEPKVLKTLNSSGQVLDDKGNVVNEATDYWKKVYDQAEPKVAKYLHADGTIDENPGGGGGGADLEDNKEVTIDVSTYTESVEVTPTAGKDGMKKATVTLSNIPQPGGSKTLYAWKCGGDYEGGGTDNTLFTIYSEWDTAPLTQSEFDSSEFYAVESDAYYDEVGQVVLYTGAPRLIKVTGSVYRDTREYYRTSNSRFSLSGIGSRERDSSMDITL